MQRTLAAWVVALPAAAGGVLAAHAAAYGLAGDGSAGAHGYLPLAQAAVCALLALGLLTATTAARTGAPARPRVAAFAVAPPVAFLLQETAERGFALPLEPVVLLGLALQLPFALAAYVAARLLLRVAVALSRTRRRRPRPVPSPTVSRVVPVPRPAVALARRGRAPPASAAS